MKSRLVAAGIIAMVMGAGPVAASDLSEEQRALVQENFQQADTDRSSSLTREEFEAFIRANAEDDIGRAPMVVRRNMFDRAFGRLDKNDDGVVSQDEFKDAR